MDHTPVSKGESADRHAVVARGAARFRDRFGRAPLWAAAAPGRVNLIGEHTDYNGGFVLPIAIDRVCACVGAPAGDPSRSRILALDLGEEVEADLRAPLAPSRELPELARAGEIRVGSWAGYILGVAAQFQRYGPAGAGRNLDLAVTSTVPFGSGLSSSASLEVAVATVLEQVYSLTLDPKYMAALCRRAEHEFGGVPCGVMDQYISVMGRKDHALLIDCRSQQAERVPMPPASEAVVVVMNTNVHHALASGEYAKRRTTCHAAAEKLGVAELRDARPGDVESCRGLSDEERRCARHIVTENARVLEAVDALRHGDLVRMGRLMGQSHASLRDDYGVSCAELDTLVEAAGPLDGVFGARMTGGGFGGCAITLARPSAVEAITARVSTLYRERHGRECTLFVTGAADGAGSVPA